MSKFNWPFTGFNQRIPDDVEVYCTSTCKFCAKTRKLFFQLGIHFEEYLIDKNQALKIEMEQRTGRKTVPQVFINNFYIGGYDNLFDYYESGKLELLLDNIDSKTLGKTY